MRVNIDSQVVTDARFKRLGRSLGISWFEALGRCIPVWLDSYQRRSELFSTEDVDIIAERDGFAAALVIAGLAVAAPEGVRLRGVRDRISFLVEQQSRSQLAVQARQRSQTTSANAPTVADGDRNQDVTARNGSEHYNRQPNGPPDGEPHGQPNGSPNGYPNGSPNSPDQAPDQDLKIRERERAIPRSPGVATPSAPLSLIPSGWEPEKSPENVALENQTAANGGRVAHELEQFRDHVKSKATKSADWNAEWRKWLRRHRAPVTRTRTASGTPAPRRTLPPAAIVQRSASETAELSKLAAAAIEALSYTGDDE